MGCDRSEAERLDNLRRALAKAGGLAIDERGLWLEADEIEIMAQEGLILLDELEFFGAAEDKQAINAACDVLEPRYAEIVHDRRKRAA